MIPISLVRQSVVAVLNSQIFSSRVVVPAKEEQV